MTAFRDSTCKVLITQDTALRGAKNDIPMKANADEALDALSVDRESRRCAADWSSRGNAVGPRCVVA